MIEATLSHLLDVRDLAQGGAQVLGGGRSNSPASYLYEKPEGEHVYTFNEDGDTIFRLTKPKQVAIPLVTYSGELDQLRLRVLDMVYMLLGVACADGGVSEKIQVTSGGPSDQKQQYDLIRDALQKRLGERKLHTVVLPAGLSEWDVEGALVSDSPRDFCAYGLAEHPGILVQGSYSTEHEGGLDVVRQYRVLGLMVLGSRVAQVRLEAKCLCLNQKR